MALPNRYTGCFPPIDVLEHFNNWDYAIEEEDEEDQDETTIKPEEEQSFVTEWTALTVADAHLPNGQKYPALVEIIGGKIGGFNVLEPSDSWRVTLDWQKQVWIPFVEDWKPENERCSAVSLSDANVFPLKIATRLPLGRGGQPWRAIIQSDGSETVWT